MYDDDFSKLSWQLFVTTGGVNYYLLHNRFKKYKEKDEKEKIR